ncbi:MAG: N-acetyl-gamma-glutamyl-phosphate reductase, partial [Candidatus Dormibacteria bacterium]
MITAAVVGASGYTGGELLRLLLGHPEVEVTQITSERLGGRQATTAHPHLRGRTDLLFRPRSELGVADIIFVTLRHGESSRDLDALAARSTTIVDLAADFRLRDSRDYPRWYGWEHPAPQRLHDFVYGVAELHRDELRGTDRIATGGCLATATILGLHPLVAGGLVNLAMPVTVEAKVGSSAAGAQSSAASHHPHRSREMRSFAPTGHRHTAEILQELNLTRVTPGVAFSATAVEAVRGVLVT